MIGLGGKLILPVARGVLTKPVGFCLRTLAAMPQSPLQHTSSLRRFGVQTAPVVETVPKVSPIWLILCTIFGAAGTTIVFYNGLFEFGKNTQIVNEKIKASRAYKPGFLTNLGKPVNPLGVLLPRTELIDIMTKRLNGEKCPNIAVCGGPGMGKTTLLKLYGANFLKTQDKPLVWVFSCANEEAFRADFIRLLSQVGKIPKGESTQLMIENFFTTLAESEYQSICFLFDSDHHKPGPGFREFAQKIQNYAYAQETQRAEVIFAARSKEKLNFVQSSFLEEIDLNEGLSDSEVDELVDNRMRAWKEPATKEDVRLFKDMLSGHPLRLNVSLDYINSPERLKQYMKIYQQVMTRSKFEDVLGNFDGNFEINVLSNLITAILKQMSEREAKSASCSSARKYNNFLLKIGSVTTQFNMPFAIEWASKYLNTDELDGIIHGEGWVDILVRPGLLFKRKEDVSMHPVMSDVFEVIEYKRLKNMWKTKGAERALIDQVRRKYNENRWWFQPNNLDIISLLESLKKEVLDEPKEKQQQYIVNGFLENVCLVLHSANRVYEADGAFPKNDNKSLIKRKGVYRAMLDAVKKYDYWVEKGATPTTEDKKELFKAYKYIAFLKFAVDSDVMTALSYALKSERVLIDSGFVKDPELFNLKGLLLLQQGKLSEAKTALNEAALINIKNDEHAAITQMWLSLCYVAEERFDDAGSYLERSFDILAGCPGSPHLLARAKEQLAGICFKTDKLSRAKALLKESIGLKQDFYGENSLSLVAVKLKLFQQFPAERSVSDLEKMLKTLETAYGKDSDKVSLVKLLLEESREKGLGITPG